MIKDGQLIVGWFVVDNVDDGKWFLAILNHGSPWMLYWPILSTMVFNNGLIE